MKPFLLKFWTNDYNLLRKDMPENTVVLNMEHFFSLSDVLIKDPFERDPLYYAVLKMDNDVFYTISTDVRTELLTFLFKPSE